MTIRHSCSSNDKTKTSPHKRVHISLHGGVFDGLQAGEISSREAAFLAGGNHCFGESASQSVEVMQQASDAQQLLLLRRHIEGRMITRGLDVTAQGRRGPLVGEVAPDSH